MGGLKLWCGHALALLFLFVKYSCLIFDTKLVLKMHTHHQNERVLNIQCLGEYTKIARTFQCISEVGVSGKK